MGTVEMLDYAVLNLGVTELLFYLPNTCTEGSKLFTSWLFGDRTV